MINKRIQTICSLVDEKVVAEIGADHGHITNNLFKNNKINFAYLTDISTLCLQKARDNFGNKPYKDKVVFLVGDGLKVFENFSFLNNLKPKQVIIAGMGGLEIIKILQLGKDFNCKKFILQPQRNVVELRQFLIANNFEIKTDTMVLDGKIFYNIISAQKGRASNLSQEEIMFGKTNLMGNNEDFKKYVEYQINKLKSYKTTKEAVATQIRLLQKCLNK